MPEFTLDNRYQEILKRLAMSEANMQPVQRQVMKDLFMATSADLLIFLVDELGTLSEEDGVKGMKNMINQAEMYFKIRIQNKRFN